MKSRSKKKQLKLYNFGGYWKSRQSKYGKFQWIPLLAELKKN